MTKSAHIGSTFESFLEEEGIREEVTALAQKKILAEDLKRAMDEKRVTIAELARRMSTTRQVVYRMVGSHASGLTLDTIAKAANALDLSWEVRLFRKGNLEKARRNAGALGSKGQLGKAIARQLSKGQTFVKRKGVITRKKTKRGPTGRAGLAP
jgi:antitoxin HicB